MRRVVLRMWLLGFVLLAGESEASFVLSGQVVTETGAPIEGASVEVTKSRDGYAQGLRWLDGEPKPELLAAVVTDETGWYRVEVPRPGVWRVAVEAPGYVPMERRPEAFIGEERLAPVTLVRDAGLEVTVTAAGEPLAGARVWAGSTLSSDGVWATSNLREWRPSWPGRFTDEEGRVILPRAPKERLRVVAWKLGYRQVERTEATGAVTLETGPSTGVRIVEVVDARGKPVKEALIRIGASPSWSAGITGEAGLWELPLPGVEELALRANAGDGRWVTQTFDELPDEGSLVLELPEPIVLTGRVSDAETGDALSSALIFRDRSGRFAETGDDGRYRLVFSEPGDLENVQAVAPGHRFSTSRLYVPVPGDVGFALEPAYSIRGRVVDRSGSPVSGAKVHLLNNPFRVRFGFDLSDAPGRMSLTDPEGRFLLVQAQRSPMQQLLARADGFAPTLEPVDVPPPGEVELVLGPGAILEGRVVDGNDEPVAGARARLFPDVELQGRRMPRRLAGAAQENDFDTATDDEGRFRMDLVPSGSFSLQVDADGLASRLLSGIEIAEDAGTVDLGDVSLEAGTALKGWVTDEQGRPLSGVRVSVAESGFGGSAALRMRTPSGAAVSEVLTEEDGRFHLDDLEAETVYAVVAQKEGWVPVEVTAEVPTEEPVELVLSRGGRLFGRVTTPSGEPLARGMVGAMLQPDPENPATMARAFGSRQTERLGDDGAFSFEALTPGPVQIQVFDDQGRGSKHGPFELTTGGEVGPVTLVHQAGALVEGRVLRPDGRPAAGVRVGLEDARGAGVGDATDAGGRFRLQASEPGRYTLRAEDPELGRASKELDLHGGTERVELVLEPTLHVAGRVVDAEGRGVTRGRILVQPVSSEGEDPSPRAMRALVRNVTPLEPGGSFMVAVGEPGDYAVQVEAPGFVPWNTPENELLRVGETSVDGLVIRLDRGGKIVGRVLGLDEEELSQVNVSAFRKEGHGRQVGSVDYRGNYEIPAVDAGAWTVRASTDQPPRQVSRDAVVGEDGGATRVDLTFPENELTLRGLVLLDGEPAAETRILLRDASEAQSSMLFTSTDSFGRFRFAGLTPGRYRIQAQHGLSPRGPRLQAHRELELVTDQDVVLDLQRVEVETE